MARPGHRCKSCGAPIEFAITPKGQRIPLDVGEFSNGNIVVTDGIARIIGPARVIGPLDEQPFLARRSHFASCPAAAKHRKRGRR
jgi:hypothetical protein